MIIKRKEKTYYVICFYFYDIYIYIFCFKEPFFCFVSFFSIHPESINHSVGYYVYLKTQRSYIVQPSLSLCVSDYINVYTSTHTHKSNIVKTPKSRSISHEMKGNEKKKKRAGDGRKLCAAHSRAHYQSPRLKKKKKQTMMGRERERERRMAQICRTEGKVAVHFLFDSKTVDIIDIGFNCKER